MAVVKQEVIDSLQGADDRSLLVFTASCAERAAQIFTGLRGDDLTRSADVDVFIAILDELWAFELDGAAFSARVGELGRFSELVRADDEEEFSDTDDVFSLWSILCLRYAASYRANRDVEDAIRCAHINLNSAWQLDQNASVAGYGSQFEGEHEWQRRTTLVLPADFEDIRSMDREIGRERLILVRAIS